MIKYSACFTYCFVFDVVLQLLLSTFSKYYLHLYCLNKLCMLSFGLYIVDTFWLTVAPAWPVCLYILYIVYHIQSQVLSPVSVAMVTLRSAPLI